MSVRKHLAVLLVLCAVALSLPKISLPASETGPMTINLVHGYTFDPLEGTPSLPPELSASDFSGEYSYCLIQFPGPVRQEWKKAVERQGAELLWYVPRYAFVARVPTAAVPTVAALPEVRWLGIDQPAWKLCPGLERAEGRQTLIVVFHYAEDGMQMLDALALLGADNFVPEFNAWNKSVKLDVDASEIPAIARLPGVYWIEPYGEITPDNQNVQWVDQRGYHATDTTRVIWAKGLTGRRMIIGLTDGPMWMNHNATRDTAVGGNNPGPNHRKVVAYRGTLGQDSHGTHTSGTIAGDDDYVGGTSGHDGLAKHARLYFQTVASLPTNWDMNVWFRGPDSGLNPAVESLRALNHSMSYSRKDTFNTYVFTDMTADQFVWGHRMFLHCNSMGNYGMNQMGHPVIAKNIISTGGTQNGTLCRNIYSSSSRGPTLDGRRKPQLVSPGEEIMSNSTGSQNGYVAMSGTSMATPNMAASMALIRQYFRRGYYPTGDTLTGTPMEISAALNKAVGIVGADNDMSGYTVPDNNVGWGRVDLDSSLYFAGDTSKLWVTDETLGLQTGEVAEYGLQVLSSDKPFRVALCWSDYPGTMRAAYICVNDISLTVVSPAGDTFKGSVYSAGQSVTGGIYDTLNVEECVRRNSPEPGTWVVRVHGRNVPQGPQPFALAVTGVLEAAPPPAHDVGVTRIVAPVDTVDSHSVIAPRAVVRNFGTSEETFVTRFTIGADYGDTTTITLGAGLSDTLTFASWTADSAGTFVVRCSTELAGDEMAANDRAIDSVYVPFTGIVENNAAPLAFALGKAVPSPFGGVTTIGYTIPRLVPTTLSIYSATGALVRALTDRIHSPGRYVAAWDGKDASGRLVSAGIYLYRLEAGPFSATGKVLLSR